ncbi:MAG TPA: hypothetical protein VLX90_01240 [Steroidobacteraceae bacterium]|nr:hypothetical protein [Steroidobacteraceae bacterium]
MYDALGAGYTLLRFDEGVDTSGLLQAASRVGLPLVQLDLEDEVFPQAYRHRLVLSRPDGHVAWRADEAPDDPGALIDLIRGAAT